MASPWTGERAARRSTCALVAALALGLAAGRAVAAPAIPVLRFDERHAALPLSGVVDQVQQRCARTPGVLAVHVVFPHGQFTASISCGGDDPERFIQRPLVAAAARFNAAGARAAKVLRLQESMPYTNKLMYSYDALVWSAAARQPSACDAPVKGRNLAANLSYGLQHGETAESWTVVEAVRDTGLCPSALKLLYQVVSAQGHPVAVLAVKKLLATQTATVPLQSLGQGISARAIAERSVFVDRDGRHVVVYRTDPHGAPGLHILWWCPRESLFIEPTHAEAFDPAGTIIGGPASRGLDRYETDAHGDTVVVHFDHVIHGSTVRHDTTPAPGSASTARWNSTPSSFCFEPVIGG